MAAVNKISALILDVGNTHVRVAGWPGSVGGALADLGRWATPEPEGEADLGVLLAELAGVQGALPVVVSSVVPRMVPVLRAVWPDLRIIDHTCDLPFRMQLPEPESIGPDRLCNMASAVVAGYRRALVVDAGTATTFDLLLDNEFVGGMISPGLATAGSGLAQRSARLHPVGFKPCPFEVGRDTAAAMQAGIFHAGVGGVSYVITGLCQEYGPLDVILTGGLAWALPSHLGLVSVDWTLRGAATLGGLG